jgi:hypothetical protein
VVTDRNISNLTKFFPLLIIFKEAYPKRSKL